MKKLVFPLKNSKILNKNSAHRRPCASHNLLEGAQKKTPALRALDLPCVLLLELQRYRDTVRCAEESVEVQGHRQKRLTQTLIVRYWKKHFDRSPILDCEKSTE